MSKRDAFLMLAEMGMTEIEAGLLRLMLDDPRFIEQDREYVYLEELEEMLKHIRAVVPAEELKGAPFGGN
jgi:hypothetical protein